MGRSRGGLISKLHALVEVDGRPLGLRLAAGQVYDACEADALIEAIPEGATLLGDKGYDSNAIREAAAAARNVWANIPNRSNRKQRFGFSPWLYRQRNLAESFFNRIKQLKASRHDATRIPPIISPPSNWSAPASASPRNESTRQSQLGNCPKNCNHIERMFAKFKQQRHIGTGYDKTVLSSESSLNLAAANLRTRSFVNTA